MGVRVPLTRGMFALVDDGDAERVLAFKWCATRGVGWDGFYAVRTDQKRRTVLLHRFVLHAPFGSVVDHINHDGLDNRRTNLRLCTAAQNCWNRRYSLISNAGHRGVRLLKNGRFRAAITVNKARLSLGCFASAEEAARAYDAAASEYFGEFARLNFPDASASVGVRHEHNLGDSL